MRAANNLNKNKDNLARNCENNKKINRGSIKKKGHFVTWDPLLNKADVTETRCILFIVCQNIRLDISKRIN